MTRLIIDSDKLRVRVCGGMNCSAAGGGRVLEEVLQQALEAAGVADEVELLRAHCLGECPDGPCVRVGVERFYRMTREDMPDLVRDVILPRLNK